MKLVEQRPRLRSAVSKRSALPTFDARDPVRSVQRPTVGQRPLDIMSARTASPLRLLQRASTGGPSAPSRFAASRSMTRSYASQREPGQGREPTVAKIPPAPPAHPFGRPDVDPMTGHPAPGRSDIDPSLLVVEKNASAGQPPPASQLQFGRTFTPHMLCVPWNVEKGWGKPVIKPYGPFDLDPSATVYHYAPCELVVRGVCADECRSL